MDIPRHRLVAVTGVSGSGKSSLAFDTLFREGQRRFLETLSAYARQFLGRMEKPEVDHVEGLSPAIAVDQKAIQRGPRSTVGTITEIVDHLRVLYARAGTAHCPDHDLPLASQTPEAIVQQVLEAFDGQAIHVLAPLIRDRKGQHRKLLSDLTRKGFVRVRVDGVVLRIEEVPELERYKRHTIEVVVDRLKIAGDTPGRLREAVDAALELGGGDLTILAKAGDQSFSTQRTCPSCGREAPPLEPRLFSFNSPHGACQECDGLGVLPQPERASGRPRPRAVHPRGRAGGHARQRGALLCSRGSASASSRRWPRRTASTSTRRGRSSTQGRAPRRSCAAPGDRTYEDEASLEREALPGLGASYQRRYRGVRRRRWRRPGRGGKRRKHGRALPRDPALPGV